MIGAVITIASIAVAHEYTADTVALSIRSDLDASRYSDAHIESLAGEVLFSASPRERDRFALYDAVSLWQLDDSPGSLRLLDDLAHRTSVEPTIAERARFLSIWIRLKQSKSDALYGYSAQRLDGDIIARLRYYARVEDGDESAQIPTWRRSTQLTRAVSDYEQVPRISPLSRGALSALMPGLGQASLGLWQDAALSFALNALGIGTTISFLRSGLVFPAVASGALESFFYFGGIVNTMRSAEQINEAHIAPARQSFETVLFPELKWDF